MRMAALRRLQLQPEYGIQPLGCHPGQRREDFGRSVEDVDLGASAENGYNGSARSTKAGGKPGNSQSSSTCAKAPPRGP